MIWPKKTWKIVFPAVAVSLLWSATALANQRDEICRSTPDPPEFLDASAETGETPAPADTLRIQPPVSAEEGNPLVVARDTLEGSAEEEKSVPLPAGENVRREEVSLEPPLLDPHASPPESEISIHPLPQPKANPKPALLVLDEDPMRDDKSFYGFLSYTIHW